MTAVLINLLLLLLLHLYVIYSQNLQSLVLGGPDQEAGQVPRHSHRAGRRGTGPPPTPPLRSGHQVKPDIAQTHL